MERKLKTMDGNNAAAHVAYAFTEVAGIYPITPSSVMAEFADEWSAKGRKNIFGQPVRVLEMQSEAGAAGAVHGSIVTGALTTTFTASQGLLLMIPNMYKIAGEQLPCVIHVAARTLATHALSIFGDHSDVMACRATGFAMLASVNPQEIMDLGAVAHLSTIKGKLPFIHFFDGFRTSHEIRKIEVWDYDDLASMVDWDAVADFRRRANVPDHPVQRGSNQNPDVFFQTREACNGAYASIPEVVEDYMKQVNAKLGTDYKLFNYYGAPDAKQVLVAMGSVCDAVKEIVDYLNAKGEKVGLITVHLYRPFSVKHLLEALPDSVEAIGVLDRTKEPGSVGEPLYLDVANALRGSRFKNVTIVGGRYGLSSKDTTPGAILSAFRNLQQAEPKDSFTLSIVDDVTNLSLPITEEPDVAAPGTVACKFWGLGSDGTVGANKNSIKIIGDHTDMKVQAYFQYDSKKSGGITISHLRFSPSEIRSAYYVSQADFVACHQESYMKKYEIVEDIKPGGTFLLGSACTTTEELEAKLPAKAMRYLAQNNIKFYTCDAVKIAKELGLGNRTNMILQAAFFKLAKVIPIDDAVKYMKDAVVTTYGRKGEKVVNMNIAAVDAGLDNLKEIQVPASWATMPDNEVKKELKGRSAEFIRYIEEVMIPSNAMVGDRLPVSTFLKNPSSAMPLGTSAYEKRGVAVDVPHWIPENCIQCNQCSLCCPHAVIRPFVFNAEEKAAAPANTVTAPMKGKGCENYQFAIISSPMDCLGCGVCANVCPAKEKAIVMKPLAECAAMQPVFDYAVENVTEKDTPFAESTVKGSQFKKPLLEFSGACGGCGEAPYAKLITQLFGDRMHIANATGCTSIWGCSAPSMPYTMDKEGHGPAWSNSLFEDNAEFGLGMEVAFKHRRALVKEQAEALLAVADAELKAAIEGWLAVYNDGPASKAAAKALKAALKAAIAAEPAYKAQAQALYDKSDLFVKSSFWIFGGDGWAYDIGYGGVDHALASGENINIFVFDTEVYSNTGGQSSKASNIGQVGHFASAGKNTKKKDLAQMAISYGYVYVAQIALGASPQQVLKALIEAESYDGPSLIIAYAPCINHGPKLGMGKSIEIEKNAVAAGYWNIFRYDPRLEAEGKNPLSIDQKAPNANYQDFLMSEVRYSSLTLSFPDRAKDLFAKSEENAKVKYEKLLDQKDMYDHEGK